MLEYKALGRRSAMLAGVTAIVVGAVATVPAMAAIPDADIHEAASRFDACHAAMTDPALLTDLSLDEPCAAQADALDALMKVTPTTLGGLQVQARAMLADAGAGGS